MDRNKDIERSLIKKFRKPIWKKFIDAVKEYKLVNEGDKIAVCISGGKDSMLMAKCLQELKKHGQCNFDLVFLLMDPGYNEENRRTIENNAKLLDIPLNIFETQIFDIVSEIEESPCYLCARMRRGYLYKEAQSLGCNKIALGHHFDDVIETVLMGMFYNGQVQSMMPKLHSTNHKGMELIRPLYMVREEDIIEWKNYNDLRFIQCACRFTENCTLSSDGVGASKRQEVKELIKKLRKKSDLIDKNIFRSMYNVKLNTVIGYQKDGIDYHFLDDYDSRKED